MLSEADEERHKQFIEIKPSCILVSNRCKYENMRHRAAFRFKLIFTSKLATPPVHNYTPPYHSIPFLPAVTSV